MTETHGVPATSDRGEPERRKDRRPGLFARIGLFVRQVVAELRKVVWPTRSQLITYTTVVIVFVAGFMAIVLAVDAVFAKLVLWVFG